MADIVYFNGNIFPSEANVIPVEERGHQFGDGVYEGIRVYGGRPFLLIPHIQRLIRSLAALAIQNPFNLAEWSAEINRFIELSGEQEGFLYLQVTRGIAPRTHLFPTTSPSISMTLRPTAIKPTGPISTLCVPDERWPNAYVKSINLLPNTLAKEAAKRQGAFEAIFVRNGVLLEGASSNLWFVVRNTLRTAPVNRYILAGITRAYVVQLSAEIGIPVVEEAITLNEMDKVDEMFLTGTSTEIQPIDKVWVQKSARAHLQKLPEDAYLPLLDHSAIETLWSSQKNPVTTALVEKFALGISRFRSPIDENV